MRNLITGLLGVILILEPTGPGVCLVSQQK